MMRPRSSSLTSAGVYAGEEALHVRAYHQPPPGTSLDTRTPCILSCAHTYTYGLWSTRQATSTPAYRRRSYQYLDAQRSTHKRTIHTRPHPHPHGHQLQRIETHVHVAPLTRRTDGQGVACSSHVPCCAPPTGSCKTRTRRAMRR